MDSEQKVVFTIHGKKPNDFTIERLAEYLQQLAILVGAPEKVRIHKISPGSVKTQLSVQADHFPRFTARMTSATTPLASREVRRTVEIMREMLSDDGVTVDMRAGRSRIFHLRGYERTHSEVIGPFWQPHAVRAQLIGIEGKDETKHVRLLETGTNREIRGEIRDQSLAEWLTRHLWKGVIEVEGSARLERSPEGFWRTIAFRVDAARELDQIPLRAVLKQLGEALGKDAIDAQLRENAKNRGQ